LPAAAIAGGIWRRYAVLCWLASAGFAGGLLVAGFAGGDRFSFTG